jgi:hypothetical protein
MPLIINRSNLAGKWQKIKLQITKYKLQASYKSKITNISMQRLWEVY